MKEDFRLNNNIQVAMLPTTGEYCPFGESLIVSGWGTERLPNTTVVEQRDHRFLWAVKQKCVDAEQCTMIQLLDWDKDSIICAKGQKDIRDSVCKGDSGGNVYLLISSM